MKDESVIKDYLQNRLSPHKRAELEQEISSNAQLAETVRQQAQMADYIELQVADELRQQLSSWDQETPHGSSHNSRRRYLPLLFLLLCLLLGAGYWYHKNQIAQADYTKYAMVDPSSFAMRGAIQEQVSHFLVARQASDHAEMEDVLSTISESYDRKTDLVLLLAESYWRSGKVDQASILYKQASKQPLFRDKSQLQELYALSKTDQDEKYSVLYNQLSTDPDFIFTDEIKEINELRNHWLKRYLY